MIKTFIITYLVLIMIIVQYILNVIQRFHAYKETPEAIQYSDSAILKEAIKYESSIHIKALIIFVPITLIIDIVLMLLWK